MKYFKDSSKNPHNNFKIGLANLFIELNEQNTANHIYSRFTNHSLQLLSENIFISPQFVEDLTNFNFNAVLQVPLPTFNIENELSNCVIPNKLEESLQAYRNQLDKGNIQFIDSYFDPINNSHLALLTKNEGKSYSWKTIRNEQIIINNGQIEYDSNLNQRVLATLQVYKNN